MGPRKHLIALVLGALMFVLGAPLGVDAGCVTTDPTKCDPRDNDGGGGGGEGTAPARPRRPKISINNVSELEGTAYQQFSLPPATNVFTFDVTLNRESEKTVKVDYATSLNECKCIDFVEESGTLIFKPGNTSKSITIEVIEDFIFEPDETFQVALSNPKKAKIKDGTGVGTILNDDIEES